MTFNLPQITWTNLLHVDPVGEKLWQYYLTPSIYSEVRDHFEKMGEAGALATPLSRRADRKVPELVSYNALGERISEIEYDRSYLQLQELSYGRGIVSIKFDPEFLRKHRTRRHMVGFGAGYYFAQTETGVYCPICMTDALARVLERQTQLHPEAQRALTRLGAREDYWQGAMFLTERQGGSDVGANLVEAQQREGRWFLSGHKWFCSNVDAEAILALARMPGGAPGTKGLGLFLILRDSPADNHRTMEIQRLKDKLGVRSMPSGEVILQNTEAYLIAGEGAGFKAMADMVNMSRLYNAVASMGVARRAILEAVAFGSERTAFGEKLINLPLWRAAMADVIAEHWGLMHLVFEAVRQLDLADQGDVSAQKLSRLLTPMAKSLSARFSVFAASECMEAIGGIAYIEESILPRLLRDAQVLPIWEGTSNIQALDLVRVMNKEGLDVLWPRLHKAFGSDQELKVMQGELAQFTKLTSHEAERRARSLCERLGRLIVRGLLTESARHKELAQISAAALERVSLREGFTTAPALSKSCEMLASERALLEEIVCTSREIRE